MASPAENAATVREALELLARIAPNAEDNAGADALPALAALLAQAEAAVRYREWVSRIWATAEKDAWEERNGPDSWALELQRTYRNRAVAAEAERDAASRELTDLRQQMEQLREQGDWPVSKVVRERDQAREALHRLYQNPTNPTALALARAALTGEGTE